MTLLAFVRIAARSEIEPRQIQGMDEEQLLAFLREEAVSQADEQIAEQIEENLPEDAEDQSEWNWASLSRWANSYFGLNTNDRELKKVGRENLQEYLRDRANAAIERIDFSPTKHFLAEDFLRRTLCGWPVGATGGWRWRRWRTWQAPGLLGSGAHAALRHII